MQQKYRSRGRHIALGTLAALVATTITACGGDDGGSGGSGGGDGGPVTISVATFNEFGYEELIDQWNAENDDIKIEQVKVGTWDDARANLYTKLAAGSGLSDIEAIKGDAMAAILSEEGAFEDLTSDEVADRWLPFVSDRATNEEGQLIGYGTDIGPEGICYRADLFEKAGLPTDREEVAKLMTTWDDYFALGEDFVQKVPETAWYDSSGGVANAMLNQVENPFETDDNEVDLENEGLQEVWTAVTDGVDKGLSTKLPQWSDDWTSSFQNNGFATMACPGWMLGVIEGNAEGVKGWDIANVFPGGGGNWGGSYLTVPSQGENIEEAKEVAAWLTAPEQQIVAFKAKGTFPSQQEALKSPEITGATNEFFNNAPTGKILAERAEAVTVQPHKGPKYSDILAAFAAAILRVDDGSQTADESWEQFVTDVEAL